MKLPKGTIIERGTGNNKYKVTIPAYGERSKITVQFGDKRYEQYKDTLKGWYSNLDHNDKKRRAVYRKRHEAIKTKDGTPAYKVRYSPAYMSYHFLW